MGWRGDEDQWLSSKLKQAKRNEVAGFGNARWIKINLKGIDFMHETVIHIGAPRTGTTVIQKYLLPNSANYLVFQKEAYQASGTRKKGNPNPSAGGANPETLLNWLSTIDPRKEPTNFFNSLIINSAILSTGSQISTLGENPYFKILKESIKLIEEASNESGKPAVISSERLCDTSASLVCRSSHIDSNQTFAYISACKAISESTRRQALVSVCLREPISYLRSKYLRTFLQRQAMQGERDLSPTEFTQKQITLESHCPGTSALTPAMHKEFIKQIQQHAFVKAFGFQELLASDDIFSLMGLQGEDKYAFRDFPRENKLPFTKEQEQGIENEITQALKQYGFYDRIMKAQMFE
ncbi:hypothetical protein [Synechococcus sp. MU1617]|uniref:hypothetical protein n=1 Tax=Synechococcus sp. MU1617 TaxID=2508346 RepID=UPI001CF85820|nr:hypothetical protein [Synechococcus sp. MU1617]